MVEFDNNPQGQCAKEIITWLLKHEWWIDTTVYVNGKMYSCCDAQGHYHYDNIWDTVFVEENIDPNDYLEYNGDFLSMSFEGPLYDVLNLNYSFGIKTCDKYIEEFNNILNKYNKYYELGNAWNLSLYDK